MIGVGRTVYGLLDEPVQLMREMLTRLGRIEQLLEKIANGLVVQTPRDASRKT